MFIKLQNKGENTKLMIKNLLEKDFFGRLFFFRVKSAWGAAAQPPPLDPPLHRVFQFTGIGGNLIIGVRGFREMRKPSNMNIRND